MCPFVPHSQSHSQIHKTGDWKGLAPSFPQSVGFVIPQVCFSLAICYVTVESYLACEAQLPHLEVEDNRICFNNGAVLLYCHRTWQQLGASFLGTEVVSSDSRELRSGSVEISPPVSTHWAFCVLLGSTQSPKVFAQLCLPGGISFPWAPHLLNHISRPGPIVLTEFTGGKYHQNCGIS